MGLTFGEKLKNSLNIILFSLTVFFAIIFFSTCEIGLGAAVDTEAPDIAITGPEAGAVIRDSFNFYGTWSDDGEINSITFTLKDIETNKTLGPYPAEVAVLSVGNGTWSYIIEKDEFADGSYDVTVSIKDKAGHKTETQRQITIDNTAPVMVLQRPFSALGSQDSIESYGQIFTLEGQAADDSGLALLEVNVYSDAKLENLIKTLSFTKIGATISVDAAQFSEDTENDYSEIYGSTSRNYGVQTRYCRIIAYDGAKRYPVDGSSQTEADLKGNATTSGYYLYDDISDTILSEYKITELYSMKNGRYSDSKNSRSAVEVLEDLSSNEISASVFTLNPKNNPLFTVAGFTELGKEGDYEAANMTVINEDFLTIQVEPGLDDYLLQKDTLKVKLTNTKNENEVIIPSRQVITKDGEKYKIVVYMRKADGLKTSNAYLIEVEGSDEKGNSITTPEGKGYGFYFKRTSTSPTLTVTQPYSEDKEILNASNDSITFKGTILFPSDLCDGGDIWISDIAGNYKWKVGSFTAKDAAENWTYTLKLLKDNSSTTYKDESGNTVKYLPDNNWDLYIYAEYTENDEKAETKTSDKISRKFLVDTQQPAAPELKKINDAEYKDSNWYTSQNIIVQVETKDQSANVLDYYSGIVLTEYKINDAEWTSLKSGYIYGFSDGENTLYFRSTDEAGNISEESSFKIKVDTSVPIITASYIGSDEKADWDALSTESILNITKSHGTKIKLSITEENSVEAVAVTVAGSEMAGTISKDSDSSYKWIWISNEPASLDENTPVKISVSATDGAGGKGSAGYSLLIDTAGPNVEITSPEKDLEGEDSLSQSTYPLKASSADAYGSVALTKYKITSEAFADDDAIKTDARKTDSGWIESANKGNVNVTINIIEGTDIRGTVKDAKISEGQWYFYVYSKDSAGNESVAGRSFWTDRAEPEIKVTSEPAQSYNKAALPDSENTITIAGSASDANGIAKVEYSEDGGTSWTEFEITENDASWSKTLNFAGDGTSDGTKTFSVRASDKAGKTSHKEYSILVDTQVPEITEAIISSSSVTVDGIKWYKSTTLVPQVTASDNTGISKVEYSFTSDGQGTALTNVNGLFTAGVTFPEQGENLTLYLKATDAAGNTCSGEISGINIDNIAPKLTAKSYKVSDKTETSDFSADVYVNADDTLNVTVSLSDSESGVKGSPEFYIGGSQITGDDKIAVVNDAENKTWTATIKESALATGQLSVSGEDKAGNKTSISILNIIKDTEAPTLSNISMKESSSSTTKAYEASAEETAEKLVYYVNTSKTFTVAGSSSDNRTVASTKLKIGEKEYTNTGSAMAWNFALNDLASYVSDSVKSVDAVITVTDLAGNTGTKTITIKFDNAAPDFKHRIDAKAKDVDFRIGEYANDNGDSDVGGKYQSGTWGTATSLTVRGTLDDSEGSGFAKLYYKVFATKPKAEDISNFEKNFKTDNSGTIDASSLEEKNVDYTKKIDPKETGTTKETGTISIKSSYKGNITKLNEESNYILFVAEDNVGNSAIDNMTAVKCADDVDISDDALKSWNKNIKAYSLNVDTTPPAITTAGSRTIFTNGSTPVTVTGTCSDSGSGIDSVIVKIGNAVEETKATVANGTWTVEIPAEKLSGIEDGKTYNVNATAKDTAGLSTSLTVAILQGDKNAPVPAVTGISPSVEKGSSAWYVRPKDTLTIKGNTTDTYSPTVYTWLKLVPIDENGTETSNESDIVTTAEDKVMGTSWTITIPATAHASSYKGANLYVCTKDLAGNLANDGNGTKLAELTFDEKGPVYDSTSSKVAGAAYSSEKWLNNKTLTFEGIWNDDAGVSQLYYEIVKDGSTSSITEENADTYPSISLTDKGSGDYAFSSTLSGFEEGVNTVIMYAVDYLGNISSQQSYVVKVDVTAPEETAFEGTTFNDFHLTNASEDLSLKLYASDNSNTKQSGLKTAEDPVITLGGQTVSAASTAKYADTAEDDGKYLVTVKIAKADLEEKSGYLPLVVTVKDKAENTTAVTIGTINVDRTAPTVILNSPADADSSTDGIQVNGIITLKGTISDTYLNDSPFDGLVYSTDISTDISTWPSVTITADVSNSSSKNFSAKVDTTNFTDNTTYYFRAKAIDKAGNTGYSPVLELKVNQDSDRPVITFTDISLNDPEQDGTLKLSLTTRKVLRGTVTDDDGVKSLEISKNNGDYEAVPVSNGSWSYSIDDGTYESIKFKVTDESETAFESSDNVADLQKCPKITDGSKWYGKTDGDIKVTVFNLMVDNAAPETRNISYAYYTSDYETEVTDSSWKTEVPLIGGNRKFLAISLQAGDENGISSVEANNKDYEVTEPVSTASEAESDGKRKLLYSTWIIKGIDVSSLDSQSYSVSLLVRDGADNSKTDYVSVEVDNTPPEVAITAPTDSTTSSGSVLAYGSISGAKSNGLSYALSPSGSQEPDGSTKVLEWEEKDVSTPHNITDSDSIKAPAYASAEDFGVNWYIYFDGDTNAASGVHTSLMNDYLVSYGITSNEALAASDASQFTSLVKLYLWLKAEDELGNSKSWAFPVILDPQGDRPTIQFNYPESDGDTLGGQVTIYGTAEDTLGANPGVESVWVQLISGSHRSDTTTAYGTLVYDSETKAITEFTFTKNDLDYMNNNGYTVCNMKTGTGYEGSIESGYSASDYAAKATLSGSAWLFDLNKIADADGVREFDPSNGTNPVGIQIFAKDLDGKFSIENKKLVFFDADKPVIKDLMLVQYSDNDNGTGDVVASQAYDADMYVKGEWWLTGTVSDKDKVSSLIIENDTIISNGTKTSETFNYKLGTGVADGVGNITVTITAADAATPPNEGSSVISVNYDNKAPVLAESEADGKSISSTVQQNNGFYRFSSKASEADVGSVKQSGFAYTAFYFKRAYTENSTSVTKLYDVLQERSSAAFDISSEVSTIPKLGSEGNSAAENTKVTENELYWFVKTLTRTTDGTMTVEMGDTANLHVNSLVSIGGAYYLVTDISGSTVTLDRKVPAGYNKAYVALAGIIDNTIPESAASSASPESDGYYSAANLSRDDGDRMIESVEKSGTNWTWEANIYSRNIPDGPIELVYVVFDKAGNCAIDSVKGYVNNNAPRIAGFKIATDYTGNNIAETEIDTYLASNYSADSVTKAEEGGKNYYDPYANSINKKAKTPLGQSLIIKSKENPLMKVRGRTQITPEIVGGNGAVYYSYNIEGSKNTLSGKNTNPIIAEGTTDYTINEASPINIQLGDLVNLGDTSNKGTEGIPFEFTFTDETEGKSSLTEEQQKEFQASLTVYLGINASQESTPTAYIKPFYWESAAENSVYKSRGHIELESDWQKTETYKNSGSPATSGEYDADPKVSGEIVLEGTAFDEKLLNNINISLNGNSREVASYDSSEGNLVSNFAENNYGTNGIWFEITNQTVNSDGHNVEWKLYWNTQNFAFVPDVAQTDVEVTVTASNFGVPEAEAGGSDAALTSIDGSTVYKANQFTDIKTNTPGTTQTNSSSQTAYYRMDVVPYITGVTTSLSAYGSSTPSLYSRSALGRYSVYSTRTQGSGTATYEKIALTGYNLSGAAVNFAGSSDNIQSVGSTATVDSYSGATTYSEIEIPSGAISGEVYVSLADGAIVSLNNLNNNDSRGTFGYDEEGSDSLGTISVQGDYSTYKNFYNRQPNNKNNNKLTDDVYFNIWDFNSEAALAENSGLVDNLEMKINPSNGMIGFAFTNGSTRFSMPKKDTSYTKWNRSYDYMKHNALAYDVNGNSYGVSVGGDINGNNPQGFDYFSFMTSRWNPEPEDKQETNKFGSTHIRIDSIALDVDGKRNIDKDRFQSQSIAANENNIYMAYYDKLTTQIRFKAGIISDTMSKFGNFNKYDKDYSNTPQDEKYCQIIADGTSDTFGNVGEYVSIGVLPSASSESKDIVAVVWYDGSSLKFAYNTNPLKNVDQTSVIKAKNGNEGWVGAETLLTGGGEYCQLVVANDNSIHIAAYDSSNADLKYIYIPFNDGSKVPDVSKKIVASVDTYLDAGEQVTIDVAQNGDYQIPYIGYWAAFPEKPRYAYLAEPASFYAASDALVNGAEANTYTGIWECMVVPSQSSVKDSRKISVGVWKYNGTAEDDGKLAYSTTGTYRGKSNGDNSYASSTASTTTGTCYGNGTNNGVLAYVVAPSSSQYCAETAQMR
ncbi:MAG: hypothetical protein IJ688_04665 [Treponema sp.]|nr:hypothetical protein [Treponema sp.]